jgi:hypothetical protein
LRQRDEKKTRRCERRAEVVGRPTLYNGHVGHGSPFKVALSLTGQGSVT